MEKLKALGHSRFRYFNETPSEFAYSVEGILESVIDELERNSAQLRTLSEDGLSSVITMGINGRGVRAERESNSNGHVDITITSLVRTSNRMLGEAKLYQGPKYHTDGLDQILGYLTGRFPRGFIIEYLKEHSATAATASIRARLDSDLPSNQQGPCTDHAIRFAFTSDHDHNSSGEVITILHLACNLNQ